MPKPSKATKEAAAALLRELADDPAGVLEEAKMISIVIELPPKKGEKKDEKEEAEDEDAPDKDDLDEDLPEDEEE